MSAEQPAKKIELSETPEQAIERMEKNIERLKKAFFKNTKEIEYREAELAALREELQGAG